MSSISQRYKEWEKKKYGENSTPFASSSKDRYNQWYKENYADEIKDNAENIYSRVESLLKGHNGYINNYTERYKDRTFTADDLYVSDAGKWYDDVVSQNEAFSRESAAILSNLERNKAYLDENWVKSITDALSEASKQRSSIVQTALGDRDYWAQWESEDAYNKDIREQKEYEGRLSYDLEAGKSELDYLNSELNGIEVTEKRISELEQENKTLNLAAKKGDKNSLAKLEENERKIASWRETLNEAYTKYGSKDELSSYISEKQTYYTLAERAQNAVKLASVADPNSENYDAEFEKIAGYGKNLGYSIDGTPKNLIAYYREGNNVGDYKKGGDRYNTKYDGIAVSGIFGDAVDQNLELKYQEWIKIAADNMTNDEFDIYCYYLALDEYNYSLLRGEEKRSYSFLSEEYLNSIMPTLFNKKVEKEINNAPVLEQIGLNIASIPMNIFGGVSSFASDMAHVIAGQDIEPYDHMHLTKNYADAIRADTAMDIDKLTGGAAIPLLDFSAGDAYQALMSGADSLAGAYLLGGTGYGVLMGMGAASSEMKDLYERGASTEQMLAGGILAGAAEMVFEKLSIDHFVKLGDTKSLKVAIINILKQGGVEASEEAFTEIANIITDSYVMGSQAEVKDLGTFVKNVVNAGLGGFLSGGGMGTVGSAVGGMQYNQRTKKHGQEIIDKGGVESLKNTAATLTDNKTVSKLLNKLSNKMSARTVGKLANAVQSAVEVKDRAAIIDELQKGGLSKKEAQKVADFSVKISQGYEASESEIAEIEKITDKLPDVIDDSTAAEGAQVARESGEVGKSAVLAQNGSQGEKSVSQAENEYDIDTDSVTPESASKKYGAQAGAMIHTYKAGQDISQFDAAYKIAYDMGKAGVSLDYAKRSEAASYLTETQKELAYEAGRAAAGELAQRRAKRVSERKSGNTGRRKGVVKGEGVKIEDLSKRFNDPQRKAYKILSSIAEVTGIDIVLYASKTDADGNFVGAQGKFVWKEDTIYIDINAGLENIKSVGDLQAYTMLRTFTHEFVHFIEKYDAVCYNELRKLVFAKLTERGENVDELIALKQTQNMSYDAASREVVAEALTDILPDSSFIEELATEHKNLLDRIVERLKEYLSDIKAYFASFAENPDRAARALKEQVGDGVKYLEDIVKLFDKAAKRAVENYQATVASDDISGLTDEEQAAIMAYKSGGSYLLNAKLREGIDLNELEQQIVSALDKALDKLPIYKGTVYRNIQFDGLGDKEARDAYIAMHIVGETISYNAYISSSTALDGYVLDGDFVVHHVIQSASGRSLEGYGNNFESEVLLSRTAYYVTDRIEYDSNGTPTIYLTEVSYGERSENSEGRDQKTLSVDSRGQQESSDISNAPQVQRLRTHDSENSQVQSSVSERNTTSSDGKQRELQGVQTEVKTTVSENGNADEDIVQSQSREYLRGENYESNREDSAGKLDNSRIGRRNETQNAQKQAFGSRENVRLVGDNSDSGRRYTPGSEKALRNSESVRGQLNKETLESLKGTVVVDAHGSPMLVYHATDVEFDTFKKGDIGFHFGTYDQAEERANQRNIEQPRYIRAYLRIKNPIYSPRDTMSWKANATALNLWSMDIISEQERDEVISMWKRCDDEYNSAAAIRLREILTSKGYDGIVYPNGFEGEGDSYIVFYDNQIVRQSDDDVQYQQRRGGAGMEPDSADEDLAQSQSREHLDPPKYSYEWFKNKPDMSLTIVDDSVRYSRADIVSLAIKNAALVGHTNQNGNAVVKVADIDTDVIVPKRSLVHGLDRRINTQAPVLVHIGDILKNAIRVNEIIPRSENIKDSYILIGAARNQEKKLFIVSFVVNKYSNEVAQIDVLYSANAKKESAALLPKITDKSATPTDSAISISHLLEYVNRYFPDILPEDILRHFGHDKRPDGILGASVLYQQRRSALTDREVLELAADEISVDGLTEGEVAALQIFKDKLSKLRDLQDERAALGRKYKEQQFGEKVDRAEAQKTLNRMRVIDGQIEKSSLDLLSVEEKKVLGDVLRKARTVVESEQRAHDNEIYKRYIARQKESASIKKYRDRIAKDVKDMSEWVLRPDNKNVLKHIPDVLKDTVIPFITSIDFTSKRALGGGTATKADAAFKDRLEKLTRAIRQISPEELYSGKYDLSPSFLPNLEKLIDSVKAITEQNGGEFVINKMTADELAALSQVVRNLKSYVKQVNRFLYNSMIEFVSEAGDNSISAMSEMADATRRTATGNAVNNFVFWQNMRPSYAFERFGEGGIAIYDGLRRGQAQLAFNAQTIIEFAEKTYTAKQVKEWSKTWLEFETSGGTVRMPVAMAMSFRELAKQDDSLRHMLSQGVRVATTKDTDRKSRVDGGHLLTEADVRTMLDKLAHDYPDAVEVADAMQKFMADQGGKWGNFVSVKRFGEELFGNPQYFPINSDGQHLESTAAESPDAASLYALLNMSFTKSRNEKANNRIILYNIFDVFANHMASMAQYNALALPVLDAIKWFNYQQKGVTSVREQMSRAYGVPEDKRTGSGNRGYAETFVINIIKSFSGTAAQGTPYDGIGMQALHLHSAAQIAYNLRVVMQQPLAITRAGMIIDYGSIIRGMKLSPNAIGQNIREMREHSGIAAWKALGFYDVNISRGLTQLIKHEENPVDKIIDIGMKGAETADTLTWAGIWSACKVELERKQGLKSSDEGYFDAVSKLFEDVIYKTQVVDSILTKSEYIRSKGLFARVTGAFMSEPTTTLSMALDAVDKFHIDRQKGLSYKDAWQKHGRYIARTVSVYAVGAILLAAVQAVADALRDDDDYETLLEKWLEAFGGNLIDEAMPLNKLPVVSDFYDLAKSLLAALGADTYGNPPQSVFMQWYDSLVKGVEIITDKLLGEDTNYTWYGGIYKLLQALSSMTGLPLGTATREIIMAWNNTIGAMAPSLKVRSYDVGDEANIKYAYKDGFLTADEAIAELISKGLVDSQDEAYFTIQEWDDADGRYSRYEKILDAVRKGESIDSVMEELTSHGYTEKDVISHIKSNIGKWYYDECSITKQQAIAKLRKYTDMTEEEITSQVNRWSCKVVTGISYNDIKSKYLSGEITRSRAIEMLMLYGGKTRAEATKQVNNYDKEN